MDADDPILLKEKKPVKKLWTRVRMTWDFPGNLCGSVPKNPDVIEEWLNARKPEATPPNARSIEEMQEEVASTLANAETNAEIEKRVWLTFQQVNGGYVMRGDTVRAHFKDCGRVVGKQYVGKIEKESSLGWKIVNGLYVEEFWIPILRPDGLPATKIDGSMDRMVHVMGPRGPISALKRIDYLSNVRMVFTLRLLCGIKLSDIETILEYGAIHGYAGERSAGEGRYLYNMTVLD